jgi:hypothetical protein
VPISTVATLPARRSDLLVMTHPGGNGRASGQLVLY